MIIFLFGEDTYRSKQKLNDIIESYYKKNPKGLSFSIFDLKEKNFQSIKDEAKSVSMFGWKKLFVIKGSFANKEFQEKFLKEAKYFITSRDLFIIFEEGIPKSGKFFNFLKNNVKFQEFELLTGQKLRSWVKDEFKKYNVQIKDKELEKLIVFIGNDLWRFSNEIRKLSAFEQDVNSRSIDLLVDSKIETDIFKTINAIAFKNKKLALSLIQGHLARGDNPLYLLSMINFQFRNLLVIKDLIEKGKPFYLIPQIVQLHPFVVKKSYPLVNKFTFLDLKKIYQKIFQVDLDIKTGRIRPELGLILLIADL